MSSDIAAIIDYSATVAARIQSVTLANGEIVGVRSIYGAGQNFYPDPLRPGQFVQPAPDVPTEPFQHMSELPDAPNVTYETQSGTFRLDWDIPMRLTVARPNLANVRQVLLPWYDAYLGAFAADRLLGGLVALAYIRSFSKEADDDWVSLLMQLRAVEFVSY